MGRARTPLTDVSSVGVLVDIAAATWHASAGLSGAGSKADEAIPIGKPQVLLKRKFSGISTSLYRRPGEKKSSAVFRKRSCAAPDERRPRSAVKPASLPPATVQFIICCRERPRRMSSPACRVASIGKSARLRACNVIDEPTGSAERAPWRWHKLCPKQGACVSVTFSTSCRLSDWRDHYSVAVQGSSVGCDVRSFRANLHGAGDVYIWCLSHHDCVYHDNLTHTSAAGCCSRRPTRMDARPNSRPCLWGARLLEHLQRWHAC